MPAPTSPSIRVVFPVALLAASCAAPPPADFPVTSAAAPAGTAAASGDGETGPSIPPSPPAASPGAAAGASAATSGSSAWDPVPELPVPPALEEPLQPLQRSFVSVTLPGIDRPLTSVSGQGPNDLWFLTAEEIVGFARTVGGIVYHYNGKRVKSYGHPCDGATFSGIVSARIGVIALGYRPWSRGVSPQFRVPLSPAGKWSCDHHDPGYRGGLTGPSDEHVWQLDCDGDACHLEALRGPVASVPSHHRSFKSSRAGDTGDAEPPVQALRMVGEDDGWMVRDDADERRWLLRYNGVTWAPQTELAADLHPVGMWVDDRRHLWFLARRGGKDGDPASMIVRCDGHTLSAMAVPASFAAHFVTGSSSRDVWFLGAGKKAYQWDGERLRNGETPFEPADVWGSPDGEVWIVGGKESPEGTPGRGKPLAARTPTLPRLRGAAASGAGPQVKKP